MVFTFKNKYYRNGIWWFTKVLNRIVGEQFYDSMRVARRTLSMKVYYTRQHLLYRMFLQKPDMANLFGVYPKCNTTHGYGNMQSYEMYRDFQQNTINSDGSYGMWVVYIAAIYCIHVLYNYMIPWYWYGTGTVKNGEDQRFRLRDAIASSIVQDSYGIQLYEWAWTLHNSYVVTEKLSETISHPDDVHMMAMSALVRKNRYRQHYTKDIGTKTRMVGY